MIHVVVLCFRDISSICWRIFAKLLSLVHFGTEVTWLRFWVKRSKFKVTPSRRRRTALDGYHRVQLFLVLPLKVGNPVYFTVMTDKSWFSVFLGHSKMQLESTGYSALPLTQRVMQNCSVQLRLGGCATVTDTDRQTPTTTIPSLLAKRHSAVKVII